MCLALGMIFAVAPAIGATVEAEAATTYYLDLNGVLDGKNVGNITNYGTADVYINGKLAANDVSDFCKAYPKGTKYEIKDIKAKSGKQYVGAVGGILSGTIGTSKVNVNLKFTSANYRYVDLNGILDGKSSGTINGWGTADVYINGKLVANDVSDFYQVYPKGTKYEIKDIKAASGKQYAGATGSLSGTVGTSTANVNLKFNSIYYLDLNGILDGKNIGNIKGFGTADVYINGKLAANDVNDFCKAYPKGTKYEIKDIKAASGKKYAGVVGNLSGTIGTSKVNVNLKFNTVTNGGVVSTTGGYG